jgi:hypothetical protein
MRSIEPGTQGVTERCAFAPGFRHALRATGMTKDDCDEDEPENSEIIPQPVPHVVDGVFYGGGGLGE